MIQRAFRKCGISVAVDELEDNEHTDTGDDPFSDGDEDPFADIDETQSLSIKTNSTNMYCTSNLERIITCIHFFKK